MLEVVEKVVRCVWELADKCGATSPSTHILVLCRMTFLCVEGFYILNYQLKHYLAATHVLQHTRQM